MRVRTFVLFLMCAGIALGAIALAIIQTNITWMAIPISTLAFANTEIILDELNEIKESIKP